MTVVRKPIEIPPVMSPSLRGFSIDANVCRNPACDNFGVSGEDIESAKHGYDYKIKDGVLKLTCKRCKQEHLAYSNVSVLEAFHRCLPNSIPYASCPNHDCNNHYVNLFEHYHNDQRDKREKLYRVNVSDDTKQYYQARCRRCDKTFPLSKPLRLHTSKRRTWLKDIGTFINAIVNNSGPSRVMNQMDICADLYYSQLRAASSALLSYNNSHISKFMKGSYVPGQMRIYTDCIVCSIKTHRKNERHQKMKIIVSSCIQNKRSLILAFHPLFDQQDFDDIVLINDHKQSLDHRRYEYLKHPFNRKDGDPLPLLGVGGYLMDDFYAYMGHFLVLRKLLARVPTLHFYMDGEASLYNAALSAFSDRIKSRSCDIVVRKMEKNTKGSQAKTPKALDRRFITAKNNAKCAYQKVYPDAKSPNISELRRFLLAEEMKTVNQAIKESSTDKNGVLFPEPMPKIYKTAISRANSDGKIFWVNNLLPNKYNSNTRMLWLTRTDERSNSDYELNLYLNGVIFYIDNVFNAFRHRSSSTARPGSTATGHKSYNRNPELPSNLIGDFTINVAFWNFFLKNRSEQKETIAFVHGLVNKPGSSKISTVFQNRFTFANAERISKWLGT